ncbi:MGH1-like glycoside hydrolase domain-containing protein [Sphingomonas gellani]|uniref:MGH1-like glycoside hydrolase domain-containing protein n=1 Tax=Sphingomonas gellani TaxID=1166340 RepID=UPI001FCD6AE2|nr:glycosyl hydrolase family 65 protein [Sphingomonas gellani]
MARQRFGNDAAWYRDRIPFFRSSDPTLDDVYYYRWQIVRAHQRDLGGKGYITTEFANDVSWQREPEASLNDATGFHVAELRWLRDRRFADDYLDYMLSGGNDRHFSDYIAASVWGRYLVDGDAAAATRHLAEMRRLYDAWYDHLDWSKGLYWISPLLDATEYTIASIDASGGKDGFFGGEAFRPTVNSYMFAQARALSQLAALTSDDATAKDYAARAEAIKTRVQQDLWNPALGHFTDRYKVNNQFVTYWQPIRGRELAGYAPWAFDLPDDTPAFGAAWSHVMAPTGFRGPAGLRTVEPGYQYYMRQYRYEGTQPECQWNGPVWPFQTTQVLEGMINLLDHYHQTSVTRADFMQLLRQYARLHYQDGRLDLEEDYHPDTGRPIVGLARSHHYFHSGFDNLVLTGVVGIRPRADEVLEVNPLLPSRGDPQALSWFRAEQIPYHGHLVAVTWDADGRHFRQGAGLRVEVDGREVANTPGLSRIVVALSRAENAPVARPINRAMQLDRSGFPKLSASSGAQPEALHAAVDGRLWFFRELENGWSPEGAGDQWFELNFGQPVMLSRAELAFLADGKRFDVPDTVRLQRWHETGWQAGEWLDVDAPGVPIVPNGVTNLTWAPVTASRYRLNLHVPAGRQIRLVELKMF